MTHDLNGELWLPSYMLGLPNVRIIEIRVDRDRDLIIDVEVAMSVPHAINVARKLILVMGTTSQ